MKNTKDTTGLITQDSIRYILKFVIFFLINRKNQIEQRPLALFGVKGMLENSNTFISTQGFVNSMKVSGSVNLRMEGFQDQSTNDNSEF